MKIIDIHTHVYPDPIAQKATDSIKDFYKLGGGGMNGTVSMLKERGAQAGIEQFVILPVAVAPARTRHINDFILQQLTENPEFVGFGTVHAAMENLEDEVRYIMAQGLRGIKMHPDTQQFAIDDPRLMVVYEALQGKLPVILHMGDVRYDYSQPSRLRHVLELFPRLQVIAAHFGGYGMYEEAYEQLHDKDCIFDISSSMMFMEPGVAEEYIGRYGAERMAYGTDYPLWDPVTEVAAFKKLKLTDEQFEQIAHKTAERFLGL
jgi:predicted TIM-barrel fold metal-dependent hydrolase